MTGVAASLEALAARGVDPGADIYARMFAAHPEMERLFAHDRDGAIRGHMLYETIEAALDIETAGAYGENLIGCEVVNHENLGVPPEVFVTFYATVRDAARAALGGDWTAEMEAGWAALIARVEHIAQSKAPATSFT